MIPSDAVRLSLHVNASRRWRGKPTYRAVVEAARSLHLAGCSVFLVDLSFGDGRQLRDARSEYLSIDIPVVVEVIDGEARIGALLAELDSMSPGGLAVVEPVRVIAYSTHANPEGDGDAKASPASRSGAPSMTLEGKAQRITVYIGNGDTLDGRNMAAAIVLRCRELGMAGATASLGVMGFGRHSIIHRASLLGLSSDVPEKVEIVDRPDRIAEILPILEEMVDGGLIIVQDVRVVKQAEHSRSS
jgi:PII-like signaling protein